MLKNSIKLIGTYVGYFLLFSLIFVLSFHSPLFASQKILFYRGLNLMVLTFIFVGTLILLTNKIIFKLSTESIIAILTLSISTNLCFFVIFPVTFDRSVTTYLLSTLNNHNGIKTIELENYLIKEYIQEKGAVERRITEQSVTNFIRKEDDCVSLTTKGKKFLNFMTIIKKLFAIK
ncbi:hypothetical protein KJ953_00550 [Patescibacteria group bacterium]|nr:hypothetical protein [Patescibacteria group bacterium]